MAQHEVVALSDEECKALLGDMSVGRFVFVDDNGPAAIPVNFGFNADELVFRVGLDSSLREVLANPVAFAVDDLQSESGAGWSVLLRGSARELKDAEVAQVVGGLDRLPQPLAAGVHNVWIALVPKVITGRRLGSPSTAAFP